MIALLDVTGERYGRLVALRRVPSPSRHTHWLFLCDCGTETTVKLDPVRRGRQVSCGCRRAEVTAARSLKHGHAIGFKSSPELRARDHAKGRCFNPNDEKYPLYGGRGITMCDAWSNDFAVFLRDMGPRPKGTTLDRIDVNGNYEPGNCRWATPAIQARNTRSNVMVEHAGESLVLKDFAEKVGVGYKALSARMREKGETAQQAAAGLSG